MQKSGKTQFQVALECGVSHAYINQLCTGKSYAPPEHTCKKLAKAIDPAIEEEMLEIARRERFSRYSRKEGITTVAEPVSTYHVDKTSNPETVLIPLLGTCPASAKAWAEEEIESWHSVRIDEHRGRRLYMLRVKGDSMNRAEINDGDIIVIDADRQPENGQIVVAHIDGECTIKRFSRSDHQVILSPDSTNPTHKISVFTKDSDVQIRGVVEAIYWKKVR